MEQLTFNKPSLTTPFIPAEGSFSYDRRTFFLLTLSTRKSLVEALEYFSVAHPQVKEVRVEFDLDNPVFKITPVSEFGLGDYTLTELEEQSMRDFADTLDKN